jgi:predicted CXXCH cytochrome family protein
MDLPLEWAFGAGRQAVTFVTRVSQDWYIEHFATYYPALHGYAVTPGQDAIRPSSIQDAAGVLYKIRDPQAGIAGCFECHSTGPVSFDENGTVHLTEPGVHCEACHGPASDHVKDPTRHRLQNPAKLSPANLNDFCGRCHRPPAQNIDWNYSWNVRHAPVYLSQSQCFRKSKGTLTCLTCHDPHEPAGIKKISDYNSRCLGCHSAAKMPPNCVDCHMPLVSPQSPLRFTNHWIGIYQTGAKLKPLR